MVATLIRFSGYYPSIDRLHDREEHSRILRRRDGRRAHNKAGWGFLVKKLAFARRYGVAG